MSTTSRFVHLAAAFVAVSAFLAVGAVQAQTPGPPTKDAPDAAFDWVQLKNGEWVKGEIKQVRDGDLHFDSDEFGEHKIGWGDIAALIPSKPLTLRFEGQEIITGTPVLADGVLRIQTDQGVVERDPAKLITMVTGTGRELDWWSFGAGLGFSMRSGNTKQQDLTATADIIRRTGLTRLQIGYRGNFGSSGGATTVNDHRVPASFDLFLTRRLFLVVPTFEYFTDSFQNLNRRITTGAGLGYEVWENSWFAWELGADASYQNTAYETVAPGESLTDHDAAIGISTNLDFDLPRGIEWNNYYKVQVVVTDTDKTNHHGVSSLEFDIWGPLEFDLTFTFDRIETPKLRADLTRPKSNDYRLTAGLSIDL